MRRTDNREFQNKISILRPWYHQMNDRLVLAEILYIYLNHESCGWTSPVFWDRVCLHQVQRFLDFTEDIEYDGSLHGDLPLDESPQPTSQKKVVFNPRLAWHAKKGWVILESKHFCHGPRLIFRIFVWESQAWYFHSCWGMIPPIYCRSPRF